MVGASLICLDRKTRVKLGEGEFRTALFKAAILGIRDAKLLLTYGGVFCLRVSMLCLGK